MQQIFIEEKYLEVEIIPGFPSGQSLIIRGEGNQYVGQQIPGDIILRIIEVNNTVFKRQGKNLIFPINISLKRALCGFQLNIVHLDGRKINVKIDEIIKPGMEHVIQFEGMPDPGNKTAKGNLIISFQVEFPRELSKEIKTKLFNLL